MTTNEQDKLTSLKDPFNGVPPGEKYYSDSIKLMIERGPDGGNLDPKTLEQVITRAVVMPSYVAPSFIDDMWPAIEAMQRDGIVIDLSEENSGDNYHYDPEGKTITVAILDQSGFDIVEESRNRLFASVDDKSLVEEGFGTALNQGTLSMAINLNRAVSTSAWEYSINAAREMNPDLTRIEAQDLIGELRGEIQEGSTERLQSFMETYAEFRAENGNPIDLKNAETLDTPPLIKP